jgi:hypothetical protein
MTASEEDQHLVYLLTRKSDSQQYIGITIERRMKQRMGVHKRSKRFRDDDFTVKILEKNEDRQYINDREEYWIRKLDTFNNGLNESWSGKGYGHNSPNFTTTGYLFSEESREKIRQSAKKRGLDSEYMRQMSINQWKNPEMRKHHSEIRKGKRLSKPKLSDERVAEIRSFYESIKDQLEKECEIINKKRHEKNSSWKKTNAAQLFAKKYSEKYSVSDTLLRGIVLWKTRTKILPSMCKS